MLKTRTNKSHGNCTPEGRLDRFHAVDESISWISSANSVALCIFLSSISCK